MWTVQLVVMRKKALEDGNQTALLLKRLIRNAYDKVGNDIQYDLMSHCKTDVGIWRIYPYS